MLPAGRRAPVGARRRQRLANHLLDLLTHLHRQVLVDVRLQGRIVLRNRRVCRDVRVVILIRASYQRHAYNRVLILRQRVQRARLFSLRHQQ